MTQPMTTKASNVYALGEHTGKTKEEAIKSELNKINAQPLALMELMRAEARDKIDFLQEQKKHRLAQHNIAVDINRTGNNERLQNLQKQVQSIQSQIDNLHQELLKHTSMMEKEQQRYEDALETLNEALNRDNNVIDQMIDAQNDVLSGLARNIN